MHSCGLTYDGGGTAGGATSGSWCAAAASRGDFNENSRSQPSSLHLTLKFPTVLTVQLLSCLTED